MHTLTNTDFATGAPSPPVQDLVPGPGLEGAREDGTRMTKKIIRKICQETGLYQRPDLNTKLYLHRRGFKKIENLDEYTEVQALWLGGNGIRRLENLHPLSKLKCLFLAQNGLSCIENLECCPDLTILDLSENSISRIEGLGKLKRLSSFKIARNKLTSLSVGKNTQCFPCGQALAADVELLLHEYCSISQDISALGECPSLTNVDMSYNALCFHEETGIVDVSDTNGKSCSTLEPAPPTIWEETKTSLGERHQHAGTLANPLIQSGCQVKLETAQQEESADSPIPLSHEPTVTAMRQQSASLTPGAPESGGFVECFKRLPCLATLYLVGNPLTTQITQYRRTMIANLPALRYLDDRPVKEEDHEAALAWFRGGWEEEQKVIKAHKEREQEVIRGHISTLRRLQEAHRRKINMALERISREAAQRQNTGVPQEAHAAEVQCQSAAEECVTSSGRENPSGLNGAADEGTDSAVDMTSSKAASCGLLSSVPAAEGSALTLSRGLVHP
ncbi:leucine rich repeat protein, putative [Eimeria brunetti]|uniref:Leucine rich repeat protein, putative n=1 Tax=Eimeria brunetti TaxID=51314 RepID=U6LN97_9EIME|nr:leucine rich repeat protein, putative [Eimeria brunetti]